MTAKLISINEYLSRTYEADPPHRMTIIRWIKTGKLLGTKDHGRWRVFAQPQLSGNDLVDKVLMG